MIDIGTSSAISAYSGNIDSVYSSPKISPMKDKQENSDEKKSVGPSYPGEIKDEAIISDQAKEMLAAEETDNQNNLNNKDNKDLNAQEQPEIQGTAKNSDSEESDSTKDVANAAKEELPPEEKQEVAKLKARDTEVKAHEQAHIAAASGINASAPSYEYQTGPDGKKYAVGGEVNISFTEGGDPASDIAKAEAMKAAALAPAQPSSQDLSVARNADRMISEFREEQAQQKTEEAKDTEKTKEKTTDEGITKPVADEKTADSSKTKPADTSGQIADNTKIADDNKIANESPLEASKPLDKTQVGETGNAQSNAMPISNLLGIKI